MASIQENEIFRGKGILCLKIFRNLSVLLLIFYCFPYIHICHLPHLKLPLSSIRAPPDYLRRPPSLITDNCCSTPRCPRSALPAASAEVSSPALSLPIPYSTRRRDLPSGHCARSRDPAGTCSAQSPLHLPLYKRIADFLLSRRADAAAEQGIPRSVPRISMPSSSFNRKLISIAASLGCSLLADRQMPWKFW